MIDIQLVTQPDETGLGRLIVDGKYYGVPVKAVNEIETLRQRVKDEQGKNIQLKLSVLKAKAKLTAERAISDKLEKTLTMALHQLRGLKWIPQAEELLAELAAMRKGDAE